MECGLITRQPLLWKAVKCGSFYVCVCLAFCAPGGFAAAVDFKFAVLADSQFNHPQVYEQTLYSLNLLRPRFVIQVGDLINGYTEDEAKLRKEWVRFKKQISILEMPYYPVVGNHDVTNQTAERIFIEVWGQERLLYSFNQENSHFVVLNTSYHAKYAEIGPEETAWLKNDLAQAFNQGDPNKPAHLFVFMHDPLWRTRPEAFEPIHQLLKQYPTRYVFGGHTHEYLFQEREGIGYVILNTSGEMWSMVERAGRFHAFMLMSVQDGKVSPAVIKCGSVLPVDTIMAPDADAVNGLSESGGVIRVATLTAAGLDAKLSLPLKNPLKQPLTWEVEWQRLAPGWSIDPMYQTVELSAGSTGEARFQVRSPAGVKLEGKEGPVCQAHAAVNVRAGQVDRVWEAQIAADRSKSAIPTSASAEYTKRYELFAPKHIQAGRCAQPPVIDGNLDDLAWQACTPITFEVPPGLKTEFRVAYNQDGLYFSGWAQEPNPEGLKAAATGEIPATWEDDDLEIYLDPGMTMKQFYRLFTNVAGTSFLAYPSPEGTGSKKGGFPYTVKTRIGESSWSLEARLLYKDMKGDPPTDGAQWGVNFKRFRFQSRELPSNAGQWSPMSGYPYEPEKFGVLEFGG